MKQSHKECLNSEYKLSPLSRDWLRADSNLIQIQARAVLKEVKKKIRGKWFRYEQINDKPKTMRVVRCNKGDPGSFLV